MPDLFSPYTLKGVTLRNRIAMSPMTMYRATDGCMNDYHVMLMGSRAAGGFGLVFPEQIAITPDGRTGTCCAGIYDDSQTEGLARVAAIIKQMGAVPAIQLGHTGRKGSEQKPWEGKLQVPPGHPDGWQVRGPSPIPYGGRYPYPVHELTVDEIHELHRAYAAAAHRALELVIDEPERRCHLEILARDLRSQLQKLGFATARGEGPIIPLVVGDPSIATRWAARLLEAGCLVPAIRPPTVPKGTARLRISLTAAHDRGDLLQLVDALRSRQA